MGTYSLNYSVLDNFCNAPSGPVGKVIGAAGERVLKQARAFTSGERVRVRTGRLNNSWTMTLSRGPTGPVALITNTAPYAIYLEDGTHSIRARNMLHDALQAAKF